MSKPRGARWPLLRPGREMDATSRSRKNGRRDQRGLTAAPWRPDVRRGTWRRGLLDRPPVGMKTPPARRPIGEKVLRGSRTPVRGAARRAPEVRAPACASGAFALGLDGTREIRRCSPTPSPPHSAPPPLRQGGETEGAVLSPRLCAAVVKAAWTPHPHPSIPSNPVFLAKQPLQVTPTTTGLAFFTGRKPAHVSIPLKSVYVVRSSTTP